MHCPKRSKSPRLQGSLAFKDSGELRHCHWTYELLADPLLGLKQSLLLYVVVLCRRLSEAFGTWRRVNGIFFLVTRLTLPHLGRRCTTQTRSIDRCWQQNNISSCVTTLWRHNSHGLRCLGLNLIHIHSVALINRNVLMQGLMYSFEQQLTVTASGQGAQWLELVRSLSDSVSGAQQGVEHHNAIYRRLIPIYSGIEESCSSLSLENSTSRARPDITHPSQHIWASRPCSPRASIVSSRKMAHALHPLH